MDGSQSAHGDKRVVRCTTRNCGPRPFESLRALTLVPGALARVGQAPPLRRSLIILAEQLRPCRRDFATPASKRVRVGTADEIEVAIVAR